jgi:hypothetical protein
MQQKISKTQKYEEPFHFFQEVSSFMEEETRISRGANLRGVPFFLNVNFAKARGTPGYSRYFAAQSWQSNIRPRYT